MAATLEPKLVGRIDGNFFVPAYQRGYRWGEDEVGRLLDDIHASTGTYYLQPIVVKAMPDGRWELIDGQQRLTTLYLIFQFMLREGLQATAANYSLEYATRAGSQEYLESLDEILKDTNIDYFHMHAAYRCIAEWFEGHGTGRQYEANKFYNKLFEDVQVIWYEAPGHLDSSELFRRLNVGRIPLTDAELVKALLLSRSGKHSGARPSGDSWQSDNAEQTAAQWDAFERDLRDPDVWSFVTGRAREESTHISLLLDTLAGGPRGRERPRFHTFETLRERIEDSPHDFWRDVEHLHSLVIGWYEDRDLYHKVGYLVATGDTFTDLVDLTRDLTKSSIHATLDARIAQRLNLTRTQLGELEYKNDYDKVKCTAVLLLMNVETLRRRRHSSERYSFHAHASGAWSLEHIHAQNAEKLNRAEQWAEWLRVHRDALDVLPDLDDADRAEIIARIDDALAGTVKETAFDELEPVIIHLFSPAVAAETEADNLHTLSNLALLMGRDNSALNNSVFEVKRRRILELDKQGSYIPVCTRNVFLKYYTDSDSQQLHFWGPGDRTAYFDALLDAVGPYLTADPDDMARLEETAEHDDAAQLAEAELEPEAAA